MKIHSSFLVASLIRYKYILLFLISLAVLSFIYSTHLSLVLIPNGYDFLFHLGNIFALQTKFSFKHNSLAFFGISPLIFYDYGYGTHLFYPPLAHLIPAFIAFLLTKVGINSTLLVTRLFSFLTIYFSGLTMFYTAKKISNNIIYAVFASLLYLSAPYLQMDYYWRGGMSSNLCFVFLPILLLSLHYFIKEKFSAFFLTLVISMTLIFWTHIITALSTLIFFALALAINFIFTKKKKAAIISTLLAGFFIVIIASPFLYLLFQQYILNTHIIFSNDYPFKIADVARNTISFKALFDIQFAIWKFKPRLLFALFNLINLSFFLVFILQLRKIIKNFKNPRFLFTLIGMLIFLLIMVTTPVFWRHLPSYFAFIQFPYRLLLQATTILSLLIALPFITINKLTQKTALALGILGIIIILYTFKFNSYHMYELKTIDYVTHSIIQATGVEQEYLPIKAKEKSDALGNRLYTLLPLTNNNRATPSASIITNETPYLLAKISNNESKKTLFELPRLYYSGYELRWQPEGTDTIILLPYSQSENGLITSFISGNGKLEVQYTGEKLYTLFCFCAFLVFGYFIILIYKYSYTKKPIWFERI